MIIIISVQVFKFFLVKVETHQDANDNKYKPIICIGYICVFFVSELYNKIISTYDQEATN